MSDHAWRDPSIDELADRDGFDRSDAPLAHFPAHHASILVNPDLRGGRLLILASAVVPTVLTLVAVSFAATFSQVWWLAALGTVGLTTISGTLIGASRRWTFRSE